MNEIIAKYEENISHIAQGNINNYFVMKFLLKLSLLNTYQLSRGAERDMANILRVSHILQLEVIANYEK